MRGPLEMGKGLEINSITNGKWFHPSCLCDETFTENPSGLESFWFSECIHMLESQHTSNPWTQKVLCLGPFRTMPSYISSIWLFLSYIFDNKVLIVSKVFSWFLWAIRGKLLKLRRGLWNASVKSWLVGSTGGNLRLVSGIWSGGRLVGLST